MAKGGKTQIVLDADVVAWQKGLLTSAEISTFIAEVKQKGSKLPEVEIEEYVCKTTL